MPTAAVIDDEPQFRELLTGLLQSRFPELTVVGAASEVPEAAALVKDKRPDILFLDVEMGTLTGFDLLKRIQPLEPLVVFITAHEGYALRAIKFNALDFLVKPYTVEELDDAVHKTLRRLIQGPRPAAVSALLGSMANEHQVAIADGKGLTVLQLEDILHCTSDDAYSLVHVRGEKKPLLITRPLALFDEFLRDKGFVRIHQSHLVNRRHIKRYIRGEGGEVILSDGTNLAVSRRMKGDLMKALEKIQ
jgi:two-component system LytT family response regulator